MINFFDTSSLILAANEIEKYCPFWISSVTLNELENIKTSKNKDANVKSDCAKLVKWLKENTDKYSIYIFDKYTQTLVEESNLIDCPDTRILFSAAQVALGLKEDTLLFITNDLLLSTIALSQFKHLFEIGEIEKEEDSYDGYLEAILDDQQMAEFYSNPTTNTLNALSNQYVVIKNLEGDVVDTLVWRNSQYKKLNYKTLSSIWFGNVKPIKGDIYQAMLCDSLLNNQITMVRGPAGSGKTFLSLAYLFNQLEKGKIDKIVIFCNTVATKNSAKLGYLPGTRDEKLMDSQIGNLLISKLGDRFEVEKLVQDQKLILLPMSDIRGYDTTGMNAGIYISEAQNLDIELMKLALQRVGEDSIMVVDGDDTTQVDDYHFEGSRNGMKRLSIIFRGEDVYGEVRLKTIHRSKIAEIANKM